MGRSIGAKDNSRISSIVVVLCVMCLLFTTVCSAALWLLRSPIAVFFSADKAVQELVQSNMVGVCMAIPAHGLLMTLYGVCIGSGKQLIPSVGTCCGFALIGLPMAYVLGVVYNWPRPLLGVWLGCTAALIFAAAVALAVVSWTDWMEVGRIDSEHDSLYVCKSDGTVAEPLVADENQGGVLEASVHEAHYSGMVHGS